MKLWGGRFSKDTDQMVLEFDECITIGKRMAYEDIVGSIAHAKMLGEKEIISKNEAELIIDGLYSILRDANNGEIEWTVEAEDIHMNVESLLIKRIGDVGKKLHTGRSRNDQVSLDNHMIVMKGCLEVVSFLEKLISVLIKTAKKHLHSPIPGYTHLQRAQPITFAHYLMAYVSMFRRDIDFFIFVFNQTDEMPLGAGALAGTTFPIDRKMVADILGFSRITDNSLDSVSNRDYFIQYIAAASTTMMHLSRFCEEIVIWCTNEFSFVELDDSFSTGSSIMPQKKNPDIAELIRGKTGRVFGMLMGILTMMKNLPLAYNKDMQEDKEFFYDTKDTLHSCLTIFTEMFKTMKFNTDKMKNSALEGFSNATDCADYLVNKGMAFRDAHEIVGKLVAYCLDKKKTLLELSIDEYKNMSVLFGRDIYEAISLDRCISYRNLCGGPAAESVIKSIDKAETFLFDTKKWRKDKMEKLFRL